ncbi:hypothetical protein RYX36_037168 [Vicia faba]
MKDTIVLYLALDSGHLMSMVELGKLIVTQHPSFSITILILTLPNKNTNNKDITLSPQENYIASVSATFLSFNFNYIPPISSSTTPLTYFITFEISPQSNHHVDNILQSISKTTNLKAVILDLFTYSAYQIAKKLEISTYFYYTSGAVVLAIFLHLPTLHQNAKKRIQDPHMPLRIPGFQNNFTTDDYLDELDSESDEFKIFLQSEKVVESLNKGLFVPNGTTLTILSIGPLITSSYGGDENGCLRWLDLQPSYSVVLLSFGSMGRISKAQLKEIALGLEKSEQRFLWIIRSELDSEELNLEDLSLEGFLDKTEENEMVVRNWAPQGAILRHDSIGGFVNHCGLNLVLEAVYEGVPMVTWPLYAEQSLNKVILVEEMKMTLELNKSKDGFVSGIELGDRIKELMGSYKGNEGRQMIFKTKICSKEARDQNGLTEENEKDTGEIDNYGIPGLPNNFTTDDYPYELDSESDEFKIMLESVKTMTKTVRIIVNTFDAIEGKALEYLNKRLFIPNGITPIIFSIGPMITSSYGGDENGCLRWLDLQPSKSFVLLSFGSMVRFPKAQLKEMALGLEKSKQIFLWIVRSELDLEELNLEDLSPEEFLDRTKENGMVVRNWAPQGAILSHDSIGGFVTHYGWNPMLEVVHEGVPMVAWPLYVEQSLNKVILVEEMKVALEVDKSKDGFVSGIELGDRIKELVDSYKGNESRQMIFKTKISSKEARDQNGSSFLI